MISIYGLINPITSECRYVGKSRNPKKRLRSHINRSIKNPNARKCSNWIYSLFKIGLYPEIVIFDEVENEWEEAEQFWIAYLKFLGANLTNMTIGGGGENRSITKDEVRLKISIAAKNQFSKPEAREAAAIYGGMMWKNTASVESRKIKMDKIISSKEYKEKQSLAKLKLFSNPEYAKKHQIAQINADHSTGAKKMWERPEYREAQRISRELRYGKKH